MAPPTGLDASAPPAQLLGVHAEGSGHAAPAQTAGLLEPHDALGEVLRQDAALYGQRQVVGGGAVRGPLRRDGSLKLFIATPPI